ncbi:hypothetical protein F5Y18DRAFT_116453 [Xylariaceae sp. FL1019]|nr:hypothetical protein F5Y18DRAFT_116453 [Xylariaceae sp. FL1019]
MTLGTMLAISLARLYTTSVFRRVAHSEYALVLSALLANVGIFSPPSTFPVPKENEKSRVETITKRDLKPRSNIVCTGLSEQKSVENEIPLQVK